MTTEEREYAGMLMTQFLETKFGDNYIEIMENMGVSIEFLIDKIDDGVKNGVSINNQFKALLYVSEKWEK